MFKKAFGIARLTHKMVIPAASATHWEQARIWDRWQEEFHPRVGAVYQEQRHKVINYISRLARPVTVLELCCGTGRLAYDLLSVAHVTRVDAVDINPQAMVQVKERLQTHPRFTILRTHVANILDFDAWATQGPWDVIICLDALPNLPRPALPALFRQISSSLHSGGCFIGNYLSSENIDAHTARKHGRLGYLRIYGRLLLGKTLAYINPTFVAQKGFLRTSTLYQDELINQLTPVFKVERLETGSYHWFVVANPQHEEEFTDFDLNPAVSSH